jgi:hypothetical protein
MFCLLGILLYCVSLPASVFDLLVIPAFLCLPAYHCVLFVCLPMCPSLSCIFRLPGYVSHLPVCQVYLPECYVPPTVCLYTVLYVQFDVVSNLSIYGTYLPVRPSGMYVLLA